MIRSVAVSFLLATIAIDGPILAASNPYQDWTDTRTVEDAFTTTVAQRALDGFGSITSRTVIDGSEIHVTENILHSDRVPPTLDVYRFTARLADLSPKLTFSGTRQLDVSCRQGECLAYAQGRVFSSIGGGWDGPEMPVRTGSLQDVNIPLNGAASLEVVRAYARLVDPVKGEELVCLDRTDFPGEEQCPGNQVGDAYRLRRAEADRAAGVH